MGLGLVGFGLLLLVVGASLALRSGTDSFAGYAAAAGLGETALGATLVHAARQTRRRLLRVADILVTVFAGWILVLELFLRAPGADADPVRLTLSATLVVTCGTMAVRLRPPRALYSPGEPR